MLSCTQSINNPGFSNMVRSLSGRKNVTSSIEIKTTFVNVNDIMVWLVCTVPFRNVVQNVTYKNDNLSRITCQQYQMVSKSACIGRITTGSENDVRLSSMLIPQSPLNTKYSHISFLWEKSWTQVLNPSRNNELATNQEHKIWQTMGVCQGRVFN